MGPAGQEEKNKIEADLVSSQWHTLRAVAKGDHIVCYYDGKLLIDAHDKSYTREGRFMDQGDSVIAFDDLVSREK